MKYFNVEVKPVDGTFHSIGGKLLNFGSGTPEQLYYINLTRDGDMTAVIQFAGTPNGLTSRLDAAETVYDYDVFGRQPEQFYLYLDCEPTGLARELLTITDRFNIVVESPMNITADGLLEISVAGPLEKVKTALSEFPYRDVRTNVKQISKYDPGSNNVIPQLTSKQREILETAVELGYYEMPRDTSQEKIAERHDCSAPTVGEHLRKIENQVLASVLR